VCDEGRWRKRTGWQSWRRCFHVVVVVVVFLVVVVADFVDVDVDVVVIIARHVFVPLKQSTAV
jgi:hypothetical protein